MTAKRDVVILSEAKDLDETGHPTSQQNMPVFKLMTLLSEGGDPDGVGGSRNPSVHAKKQGRAVPAFSYI